MNWFLQIASSPVDHPIDGRSIADPLKAGIEPSSEPVFAEISGPKPEEALGATVMMRGERFKYVWHRDDIDELYDLREDSAEMRNLVHDSQQANRIAEMRRSIVEMLERTGPGPFLWCGQNRKP